ncbi:MAG: tetratricopeptide repeat protein [Gammaproteobacteria bacterium]
MATSRPEPRRVHVFIASPGDLAVERRAFKDVIDNLNGGFGDGAGVRFVALGWEDTLATTGRRAQGVINRDIDRSDVFVLALHRRWGQEPPDAPPYTSYTEEEFHRALDRWKKTGAPEIFVFFKHVDPGQMADPGPQLERVLVFRKSLEDTRQVLYRFFEDEKAFKDDVDRHLRAYARGDLPKADAPREAVVLPLEYIQQVTKAKAEAQAALDRAEAHQKHAEAQAARADKLALTLAEQAAAAALEGHVEEARQTFARAHEGTTNLRVLSLAYEFYRRTGDLKAAEDMLERWLAISGREAETGDTAAAYGNLGVIYQTRGELERAEEMYKKSLEIEEKLGRQEGIAIAYGNLGIIYGTRGELELAEEMPEKALAIEERLGRQEGMASDYGNLGVIYETRGELERAEEMYRKAHALFKAVGAAPQVKEIQAWLDSLNESRAER